MTHEMHKEFSYDHPIQGVLLARFNKPLEIPEGITSADGILRNLSVELKEVPTS